MPRNAFANLPNLAARVFGTPHMIARPSLDAILAALGPRLGIAAPASATRPPEGDKRTREAWLRDGELAVIQVIGPLVQRAGLMGADCGDMTSYEQLAQELDAALADDRVKGIVLELDSPGGECAGLFGFVSKLAAARKTSGKPVYAVANEAAYSAAYAIASAADRVFLTETAGVGSIGVVACHLDQSAADAKDGRKFSYVFAGEKKVDGNSHEPLSDRARAGIQSEVDALYETFVKSVATHRGIPQRDVRGTEADTFMGEKAVAAGLADQIGSLEDAKAALRAELNRRAKMDLKKAAAEKLSLEGEVTDEQLLAAIDAVLAGVEAFEVEKQAFQAKVSELNAELLKLKGDATTREADHAIQLAKTSLKEGGHAPMDKAVEDDARELFAAGKPELAKRTLERNLESARAKKNALSDPGARTQPDEEPKTKSSKESVLAKAREEADKLAKAGKSKRASAK